MSADVVNGCLHSALRAALELEGARTSAEMDANAQPVELPIPAIFPTQTFRPHIDLLLILKVLLAVMEKQLKTRKPHKKSRNGCLPCKARHVKCDEVKPNCVNCDKYGSTCEYPRPKKRISSNTPASTPSSVDGSNLNHFVGQSVSEHASPTELNISHLRLLHHFTTVTAQTLVAEPDAAEVYHSYTVHIAFEFPFLMQAILAVAALHLSRLDLTFRTEYLRQAELHHNAALSQFRTEVQDIDESNYQAVLLFAAMLFPYSCALPIDQQSGPEYMLDSMLHFLTLTRRTRPMVVKFYQSMLESEIGRIIPKDTRINWSDESQPTETELVKLRKFSEVIQHVYPADIIEAYCEAIRLLEILFAKASSSLEPTSDSLLKLWAHFVSPRFMDLLSERQPGALIIFAHYAVLFHRSRHYWFFHGVAEQILHIAYTLVPSEWKAWLDWPKEQIDAASPVTVSSKT